MESTITKKQISWWDWTGVFFSGLCVIHCIATPLLLAGATLWLASEWVHVSFLVVLIPIVIMASRRSCPSQTKRRVMVLFYAGLFFLGAAIFLGESMGEASEIGLSILGSILLITGHLKNRQLNVKTGT